MARKALLNEEKQKNVVILFMMMAKHCQKQILPDDGVSKPFSSTSSFWRGEFVCCSAALWREDFVNSTREGGAARLMMGRC
jgi:hypothetical protein